MALDNKSEKKQALAGWLKGFKANWSQDIYQVVRMVKPANKLSESQWDVRQWTGNALVGDERRVWRHDLLRIDPTQLQHNITTDRDHALSSVARQLPPSQAKLPARQQEQLSTNRKLCKPPMVLKNGAMVRKTV